MAADAHTLLSDKIVSLSKLSSKLDEWRSAKKRIVFTNGCFDLLHAGHIAYLTDAAALGDILVLGLNSDRSVQRIKGPERPINDEKTRSAVLAGMFFIDAIVFFDEDTPLNVIKTVLPDVLVKGGDYKIEDIVGAQETVENGGEVQVLTFLPGYSSTAIIDKIRKN
ncbi:MAG: D-beta-D-heptose 1-phosphate adenosyltransferase [Pedobacter sp.]|jgi:rfaE bifunctional protein nucleotidyltransferase chain/domain|nr:D-beta-D-heptose 1-phosphate adenosyltransferase [Pedobacter sp.]